MKNKNNTYMIHVRDGLTSRILFQVVVSPKLFNLVDLLPLLVITMACDGDDQGVVLSIDTRDGGDCGFVIYYCNASNPGSKLDIRRTFVKHFGISNFNL